MSRQHDTTLDVMVDDRLDVVNDVRGPGTPSLAVSTSLSLFLPCDQMLVIRCLRRSPASRTTRMIVPRPISADYCLGPTELTQELGLLIEARQLTIWSWDRPEQPRARSPSRSPRRLSMANENSTFLVNENPTVRA